MADISLNNIELLIQEGCQLKRAEPPPERSQIDLWAGQVEDLLNELSSGNSALARAVADIRSKDKISVHDILDLLERGRQQILSRDIDERVRLLLQDKTLKSWGFRLQVGFIVLVAGFAILGVFRIGTLEANYGEKLDDAIQRVAQQESKATTQLQLTVANANAALTELETKLGAWSERVEAAIVADRSKVRDLIVARLVENERERIKKEIDDHIDELKKPIEPAWDRLNQRFGALEKGIKDLGDELEVLSEARGYVERFEKLKAEIERLHIPEGYLTAVELAEQARKDWQEALNEYTELADLCREAAHASWYWMPLSIASVLALLTSILALRKARR